jgi:hypothetical protein
MGGLYIGWCAALPDQTGILKLTAQRVAGGHVLQVLLKAQHLHHGKVGANGGARAAGFERPQGGRRHAGAFRHLLGSQFAPQARKLEPLAEFAEQLVGCGKKRGSALSHINSIYTLFT